MKKIIILGTFLTIFISISSISSAEEKSDPIKEGRISSFVKKAKQVGQDYIVPAALGAAAGAAVSHGAGSMFTESPWAKASGRIGSALVGSAAGVLAKKFRDDRLKKQAEKDKIIAYMESPQGQLEQAKDIATLVSGSAFISLKIDGKSLSSFSRKRFGGDWPLLDSKKRLEYLEYQLAKVPAFLHNAREDEFLVSLCDKLKVMTQGLEKKISALLGDPIFISNEYERQFRLYHVYLKAEEHRRLKSDVFNLESKVKNLESKVNHLSLKIH